MLYTLDRFNQLAAKQYLSAGAILLWQRLYFTMQRKNQFADLQQNTAALIAQLNITRQGLQLMRQALIEKGFLKVRVDEHQQTFYTLMLDGKVVGEGANIQTENAVGAVDHNGPFQNKNLSSANGRMWASRSEARQSRSGEILAAPKDFSTSLRFGRNDNCDGMPDTHTSCVVGADAHIRPLTEVLTERASGDIILTNRIRPYIDAFCDRFGPAMKGDLIQWAEMRRKNGWTLTLWGLEALFKKLIDLSGGIGAQMAQIVAQSVTRRWKGFFALKVKAKPSGEALRKQEELHDPRRKPWEKANTLQKFKPEGRDLSFLEV